MSIGPPTKVKLIINKLTLANLIQASRHEIVTQEIQGSIRVANKATHY